MVRFCDDGPDDYVPMSRQWLQDRMPVHEARTDAENLSRVVRPTAPVLRVRVRVADIWGEATR